MTIIQDFTIWWMLLSLSEGTYSAIPACIFSMTGPNGNQPLTLSVSLALSTEIHTKNNTLKNE